VIKNLNKKKLIRISKAMDEELRMSRQTNKTPNVCEADMFNACQPRNMPENPNYHDVLVKHIKNVWGYRKAKKILQVVNCTLDELPLHVNHKHYAARAVVKWRLSTGN